MKVMSTRRLEELRQQIEQVDREPVALERALRDAAGELYAALKPFVELIGTVDAEPDSEESDGLIDQLQDATVDKAWERLRGFAGGSLMLHEAVGLVTRELVLRRNEVTELSARATAAEARLLALQNAILLTPYRNAEGERLTCLVCGTGHSEFAEPPEWLVTLKTPWALLTKGLHQRCREAHERSRFGGATRV